MKIKTTYVCNQCENTSLKWLGKCPDCNAWSSFEEVESLETSKKTTKATTRGKISHEESIVPITEISNENFARESFGLKEFDRVLGGGLVRGSLVLIGGDPGIGKSTLSLQAAFLFAQKEKNVLYVSGEESLQQTKLRAQRIGALHPKIGLLAEIDLEKIKHHVEKSKPELLIVDSIQSVFCPDIDSTPGSINQIREATGRLLHLAKKTGIPVLLIGHVTKSGSIAGPKVLEHLVDTVLYFEGEQGHSYRLLRAIKNRFGATHEIGVFEMKEKGLEDVQNPSALFLDQRPREAPGSIVTVCIEGTRPLLVEVQALVGNPSYGNPRRTCSGVDPNRVAMLVAILEKKGGLQVSSFDIFVNVAGGFRIEEPAADLAIIIALASSFLGIAVPPDLSLYGEVGLAGEVRGVHQAEIRTNEAISLGFHQIMLPDNNFKMFSPEMQKNCKSVKTLGETLVSLFPAKSFV